MPDGVPWSHRGSWQADPAHVGDARHFVARHLGEHGLDGLSDVVVVVVSELTTNAVLHTKSPFSVRLARRRSSLFLTVHDGSRAPLPFNADHASFDICGRGLQIVERLSSSWGVTAEPDGKSVWARFDLPHAQATQN